jgi:hypothetical protein
MLCHRIVDCTIHTVAARTTADARLTARYFHWSCSLGFRDVAQFFFRHAASKLEV